MFTSISKLPFFVCRWGERQFIQKLVLLKIFKPCLWGKKLSFSSVTILFCMLLSRGFNHKLEVYLMLCGCDLQYLGIILHKIIHSGQLETIIEVDFHVRFLFCDHIISTLHQKKIIQIISIVWVIKFFGWKAAYTGVFFLHVFSKF